MQSGKTLEMSTQRYIEDYLEPVESVGEITGEVLLCPFDNEHCK
jgi:hypothetical protein